MISLSASRLLKLLLCLFAVLVAAQALVDALANQWRGADPEAALRLNPGDPAALTLDNDRRAAGRDLLLADAAPLAASARTALRTTPLNAPALRQLATAAALSGDEARALPLIQLAHRVSRRELGTLIWLVQTSLDRDDLDAMLRYSDEALTVDQAAADMLYPALLVGMSDAQTRRALSLYLQRNRPWMPGLLRYALDDGQGGASEAAMMIMDAGGLPRSEAYESMDGKVLAALVRKGDLPLAGNYLRRLSSSDPDIGSDLRVSSRTTAQNLGPFGWNFSEDVERDARMAGGGRIAIRVTSEREGVVASRMLLLQPGRYSVGAARNLAGNEALEGRWELRCITQGTQALIWTGHLAARTPSALSIAPDCPVQRLDLIARGGEEASEARAEIAPPTLSRVAPQQSPATATR